MTIFVKDKGVKIRVEDDGSRWVVVNCKPDERTRKYLASMHDCGIWVWAQATALDRLIPEEAVSKVRRMHLQAPLGPESGLLISKMRSLVSLHADSSLDIDFSGTPNLKVLRADWNANWVASLKQSNIEEFGVWAVKGQPDLRAFDGMDKLKSLTLVRPSILNLEGVQRIQSLRSLHIAYASKLRDIGALALGPSKFEDLDFDCCPNIESYGPLAKVQDLRVVKISKCAPIPSLRIFKTLKRLEFISFVNTPVIDNDVKILAEFPALTYAGFFDKRGYNAKFVDVEAALNERASAR